MLRQTVCRATSDSTYLATVIPLEPAAVLIRVTVSGFMPLMFKLPSINFILTSFDWAVVAFEAFKKAVDGRGRDYPLVIVSNTCTQAWEYKRYVDYAEERGYMVFSVIMRKNKDQVFKNVHGVPEEVIGKMQERMVRDFVTPKLKR